MRKLLISAGRRFGNLVVVQELPRRNSRRNFFLRCDCGKATTTLLERLRSGQTTSCGCKVRSAGGVSTSWEYRSWRQMIHRCHNPRNGHYKIYGARGISVCRRWRYSFKFFIKDLGYAPARYEIERIDNDGPYCLSNCRWATHKEQCNNRRTSRFITFNGETLTLAQWTERLGLSKNTLGERLRRGWSIERAITHKAFS